MWILLRVLVAIAAFAARFLRRVLPRKADGRLADGTPFFHVLHKRKDKGGNKPVQRVGVPLRIPLQMRLQREGLSDHWFKSIGLAQEFQTGWGEFDRGIYIACDHPSLLQLLTREAAARNAICDVLAAGYPRIHADGEVLWLEVGSSGPARDEATLLLTLRDSLREIEHDARGVPEPFAGRIAVIEAGVWSIVAYAIVAYFETRLHSADNHVDAMQLLWPGLGLAAGMMTGLLVLVVLLLRGSSLAHLVLLESGALLLLAAPIAGWQAASDLNRRLDWHPPVLISREIEGRTMVHRRKAPAALRIELTKVSIVSSVHVPSRINVDRSVYDAATPGRMLDIEVGRGWLGVPWYRDITVRDAAADEAGPAR